MKIGAKTKFKTSAATLAIVAGVMTPQMGAAEEVVLKSVDGTINVTGEFISFEDDIFTVRTALGDLRIAADRVFCEGAGCPTAEVVEANVTIAGSEAVGLGLLPLMMVGYGASLDAEVETANPGQGIAISTLIGEQGFGDDLASYQVNSTTDADAFAALLDGTATIGMSSRRIDKAEARALRNDGAGSMVSPAQEHIIAIDSMVVATHADNEVGELTIDQLRGIFSGQITNWSQVGGADMDINVIAREDGSASHEFFMSYLFGDDHPDFLPQGIAADDQVLSNTIYYDKYAIGYMGYAFQRGAKPVSIVNECGIATSPDAFSAKTEEYALNRRMYLYNRSDTIDGPTQAFLDFATSEAVDNVIAKSGFIDLGIDRVSQSADQGRGLLLSEAANNYGAGFEGEVLKAMLEQMETNDRLSTTFRFRTGSSKIDERGRLDMVRLVNYLEDMPENTTVTLVGFTDDVGAFDSNRRLSFDRASAVAAELETFAEGRLEHINFETTGFGEVAPAACNASELGRSINRRVEVWLSEAVSG